MTAVSRSIIRSEEDDFDRAFREAAAIVRPLADERAKRRPPLLVDQQRHDRRISDLEAELRRVASRIDWAPQDLERIVLAEIKKRGRFVPTARRAPVPVSREQQELNLAVEIARAGIAETERLIDGHQRRLVKQQIDLARKREAARLGTGGRK